MSETYMPMEYLAKSEGSDIRNQQHAEELTTWESCTSGEASDATWVVDDSELAVDMS